MSANTSIEHVIIPRARDIGGFEVRRALPFVKRRMVGPFIFFDQMGPATFGINKGVNVRPHPHIGLGTVTYLFDGKIHHQDSLGNAIDIEPGAVNWMIAGRGITHSERAPEEERLRAESRLSGIQTWLALPVEKEDMAPAFQHHPKASLPILEDSDKKLRLILGTAYGERAPVEMVSETFYIDAVLHPGAQLPMPDNHEDRGVFIVAGSVKIAGDVFPSGQMLVLRPGDAITAVAGEEGARLMLFGGATLDGERHIWWNFVSSSKEKIDHAKEEWARGQSTSGWASGQFSLPPGDDQEFIPLPDN